MAAELVLVTGAAGFLATHVVKQLLEGGYRVRGTVRDLKHKEKIRALKELCPDSKYPLDLVEADLNDADCWTQAVLGCDYVIHTAASVPPPGTKEDEYVTPLVNGVRNVLKACSESGTVKRVVFTSSSTTVNGAVFCAAEGKFDENNWLEINQKTPVYPRGKVLSEKAAFDFVESLPQEKRFEFVSLLPGTMMGPFLSGGDSAVVDQTLAVLDGKVPAVPPIQVPFIDVRDVAAGHVRAMVVPEAAGKRYILSNEVIWFKDFARILSEEFRPLGYKVTTRAAPVWMAKMMALFDKSAGQFRGAFGKTFEYDTTRMKDVLGINPRPVKDGILAMGHSIIQQGKCRKTEQYKARYDSQSS